MEGRRKKPRKPVNIDVRFGDDGCNVLRGRVRNISLSGAFIETKTPCAAGTCLCLTLDARDLGMVVTMDVEVVRVSEREGMGVVFQDKKAPMIDVLIESVRQNERAALRALSLLVRP